MTSSGKKTRAPSVVETVRATARRRRRRERRGAPAKLFFPSTTARSPPACGRILGERRGLLRRGGRAPGPSARPSAPRARHDARAGGARRAEDAARRPRRRPSDMSELEPALERRARAAGRSGAGGARRRLTARGAPCGGSGRGARRRSATPACWNSDQRTGRWPGSTFASCKSCGRRSRRAGGAAAESRVRGSLREHRARRELVVHEEGLHASSVLTLADLSRHRGARRRRLRQEGRDLVVRLVHVGEDRRDVLARLRAAGGALKTSE